MCICIWRHYICVYRQGPILWSHYIHIYIYLLNQQTRKNYLRCPRDWHLPRHNGSPIKGPSKPLNTIVLYWSGVFMGARNWVPMMPIDASSLSDNYSLFFFQSRLYMIIHWKNYTSISVHIEWDMIVVTVILSILNRMEFHSVQNRKDNCHHDHIPFNVNGNGSIVFSVYDHI